VTIRDGRGPRDPVPRHDERVVEPRAAYIRTGRYGRGPGDQGRFDRYGDRRGGLAGLLRFLVFLVVFSAIVLVALATLARPVLLAVVVPFAEDNPGALRIAWIADLVREDIGDALVTPAGTDASDVEFVVDTGDTPVTLAPRLLDAGLISSERAFLFVARVRELAPKLEAGRFVLRRTMTPDEIVTGLMENRVVIRTTTVTFREGLRIEQMAAKLLTVSGIAVDPAEFYRIATEPPASLLADYPWLTDPGVRPEGASLEGFLYPATYTLRIDSLDPTKAEGLIRMMLDAFYAQVGPDRLEVPEERGLTFHQILTLGSIVEREAVLDEERATIAGVYQNRLDPKLWKTGLLEADPTVFFGLDSVDLAALPFERWVEFVFWAPRGVKLNTVELPETLAGYQSYKVKGLPPGPICSPTAASIDAALAPETDPPYLFFVAIPDGGGKHDFSKTLKEHQAKLKQYGYS
jgi:UPF0755 protein